MAPGPATPCIGPSYLTVSSVKSEEHPLYRVGVSSKAASREQSARRIEVGISLEGKSDHLQMSCLVVNLLMYKHKKKTKQKAVLH